MHTETPDTRHTDVEIEFDEQDLESVAISDKTLEEEDRRALSARKQAKKDAKKLLTPEEQKKRRHKQIIIASAVFFCSLILLLAIPFTRWPILNAVGFRNTLVVTVEEDGDDRPVAAAIVRLADGLTQQTDTFGRATFTQQRLGKHSLTIQKAGYGEEKVTLTNGFGSKKSVAKLKVIGIKLDVDIKDWLSGDAIQNATAKYGEATATSDQDGRASLIIPPTDELKVEVEFSAPGYATRKVPTDTSAQSREVTLVASPKNYFISKRDGKFDIFSSNLDGTGQKKIIEATGKEDESLLQFTVSRNNKQAILVANRDGKIQNNRLVAGIYLVGLEDSTLKKIDEGSDVQLLDWGENALAYTKSNASLTYDDPALSSVMSYNPLTGRLTTAAQSNYFPVAVVADNKVLYMPADAYRAIESAAFTSYDLNSGAKKTYLNDKSVTQAIRTQYGVVSLQDNTGGAFELQVQSGALKAVDRRPTTSLSFVLSPAGSQVAWSDRRDGQGSLLVKPLKNGTERVVKQAGGLTSPVRFVSERLVVTRVVTSQETSDYIVDINTGKMAKIVDVSNIGNIRAAGL